MKQENGILSIAMFGQRGFGDPQSGGVEVVVTEFSTRMAALGHKVTCYNRSDRHANTITNVVQYKGVREKYVPTFHAKGLSAVSSSIWAAIFCAVGKYDVVHIHAEGPAAMCWLPKLFGKRVIVTVHGLDHQRAKWGGIGKKYILSGERKAVKYADEIIVLSKKVQDYFLQTYNRKTQFIPNGVIHPEFRAAKMISKTYHLKKDSYLLFVGRLVPEKGIQYLLKAFKKIKTDKKLVIAGGESNTKEFEQKLKEYAKDDMRIIFTGFVCKQILSELYSNAYIYILPSDLEGMPLTLLEAMSYGNCCLVSDIPECTEVVEDKAIVFKKSNVKDLTEKLQFACDHPDEVMNFKRQAGNYVCNKYNWDSIVENTIALYL